MERFPDFGVSETINGDDILTAEVANEIFESLKPFIDEGGLSLDQLHEREEMIKRAKVREIMKQNGTYDGQDIVFGDFSIVDAYIQSMNETDSSVRSEEKTDFDYREDDKDSFGSLVDEPKTFYSTDVLTAKEMKDLSKIKPLIARKILSKHFYELANEDDEYYSFAKKTDSSDGSGFLKAEIDADRRYLFDLKNRMDFADGDSLKVGQRFEQAVAKGIAAGNWLFDQNRDFFSIGKLKHTLEFDDFINHADYFCPINVFGKQTVIAFDATMSSDEGNMLAKLDQCTSSDGISPFGCGTIKYCHIEEDKGLGFEEQKSSMNVPLYKISVDFNDGLGFSELNRPFKSVLLDGSKALEYLSRVQNDKILGQEEYDELKSILDAGGPFDQDMIQKFRVLHNKAGRLKNLTTSFYVLSEMHEQNQLILEKDEKNDHGKFRTRRKLSGPEVDSVKKIDAAIWRSLTQCMKELVHYNGEDELVGSDSEELYSILKSCAGVPSEDDESVDVSEFGHHFGLKSSSSSISGYNRCYVNMMDCIDAERNDIVYKEVVRNSRGGVSMVAHRYRKQLEDAESEKELARDIFGTMALDSYLDNFEGLFEIAKETNSVKAFIERLGKDDSIDNYGAVKVGFIRKNDNGARSHFGRVSTIGASNHDDIILSLFENDEDRNKYFAGRYKDYAANCLSAEFFENDENIEKLLKWEVGVGRIEYILSTKLGMSPDEIRSRVDRVRQKI